LITRLSGVLTEVKDQAAIVSLNGLCYEVRIPANVRPHLRHLLDTSEEPPEITLHTWHYIEAGRNTSNQFPRLVGFLSESERDFFSVYTTVKGLGVKKALRSLTIAIRDIAYAIEMGDKTKLSSLPEIGGRTAEKVIAELRGKLAKWALIKPREKIPAEEVEPDFTAEARDVLLQLQYKAGEAEAMIKRALTMNPEVDSCQELIEEIFRQQAKSR